MIYILMILNDVHSVIETKSFLKFVGKKLTSVSIEVWNLELKILSYCVKTKTVQLTEVNKIQLDRSSEAKHTSWIQMNKWFLGRENSKQWMMAIDSG